MTKYAVAIKPISTTTLVTTGMFGGKGAISITKAKIRTWKTKAGAQKFADRLHSSQNATVVEV